MPADLSGYVTRATANIRREAAEAHKQYPQYDGYWDGDEWFLVRFTRNVHSSAGTPFLKGDITIARLDPSDDTNREPDLEAYSQRTGMNTVVWNEDCEEVL